MRNYKLKKLGMSDDIYDIEDIYKEMAEVMGDVIKDKLDKDKRITYADQLEDLITISINDALDKLNKLKENKKLYSVPRKIIDVSSDFKRAIGYKNGKPISISLEYEDEKEIYYNDGEEYNLLDIKYRVVNNLWCKITEQKDFVENEKLLREYVDLEITKYDNHINKRHRYLYLKSIEQEEYYHYGFPLELKKAKEAVLERMKKDIK